MKKSRRFLAFFMMLFVVFSLSACAMTEKMTYLPEGLSERLQNSIKPQFYVNNPSKFCFTKLTSPYTGQALFGRFCKQNY